MNYNLNRKPNLSQVVIFCGGLGTRLGNITRNYSKPLLKINNKSFILYLIKNLYRYGITEALLLCHYKYEDYKRLFNDKKYFGVKIKCIYEKELLGSAGALFNAKKYLKSIFLVSNGDTFFNFNILDLYKKFNSQKKIGIVALTKIKFFKNRYGSFNKKSGLLNLKRKIDKNNFLIYTGLSIFKKKIVNYTIKNSSLEGNTFSVLTKKKLLQAELYKDKINKFIDIGIKKDFYRASYFLKNVLKKPAIFLDRDGIVNLDNGYVHKVRDFIWRGGAKKLIKYFNDNNYYVFVITNQSGVGRGYYSEKEVIVLHNWVNKQLKAYGAYIDEFFYAPYYEFSKKKEYRKNKFLRKPNIGMFVQAKKKWDIDIKNSYVVGDKPSDMLFARNSNLKGILINKDDNLYKKVVKVVKNDVF
jgi:D-glycero-D-manno-heptose 1,7-bisphosphate phosphatase